MSFVWPSCKGVAPFIVHLAVILDFCIILELPNVFILSTDKMGLEKNCSLDDYYIFFNFFTKLKASNGYMTPFSKSFTIVV